MFNSRVMDNHKFYCNESGLPHRLDGPAISWTGYEAWFFNGQYHRLDGPARSWSDERREWWINGEYLSEQDFNEHPLVREYQLRKTFERLLNE